MIDMDMQKIKSIELEMLKEFIAVCEKHTLSYFLIGGTALGAVRHGGFIPWDDDIDIGMPRDDYEKFLTVAQNNLSHGLFLQTYETDPEYLQCFAKIRNSNTTFLESSAARLKINHGVFIDIFPLDGCENYDAYAKKAKMLKARITSRLNVKRSLKGKLIVLLSKLFHPSLKKAQRDLINLWKSTPYATAECVANFGGAWGKKEVVPRAFFGKGSVGNFEGISVRLPERVDEYLTAIYGDYMTPPPPEKQIAHHYCDAIDPEKPYTVYTQQQN